MQVKKGEMRDAILSAGLQLFLEKGYKDTSIRSICKKAGTTLGNFYNYFDSKQALFEALVSSEYREFIYFVDHHVDIPAPEVPWETMDNQAIQEQLVKYTERILPPMTDRFLLLLVHSEGTPYEGTRQQLIMLLKEHYLDHLVEMGQQREDDGFADLLAHQVVDAFTHILKMGYSDMDKRQLISQYLLFVFTGVVGVIGEYFIKN